MVTCDVKGDSGPEREKMEATVKGEAENMSQRTCAFIWASHEKEASQVRNEVECSCRRKSR